MAKRKGGPLWDMVREEAYERDSQSVVRMPDGSTEVGARCWICGDRIDYGAKPGSRFAWEPDHYYPVEDYPELEHDIANLRPSHSHCNRSRGLGKPRKRHAQDLGKPSRVW